MAAALFSSSLNVLFVGIVLLFTVAHLFFHVFCTTGFSMELIHRDSPESPLHDPASTPISRLRASIHRSASRANYLHGVEFQNANSPLHPLAHKGASAIVTSSETEYLVELHFGSHKQKAKVFIDTGSDLIWLLCYPCNDCYKSKQRMFSLISSTSYNIIHCRSDQCSGIRHECDEDYNCKYSYGYLNGFSMSGLLSIDTLQLLPAKGRGDVYLNNIIFGCTHSTNGNISNETLGIMGLGGGPLSLVNQLDSSYGRKFSYCFPYSLEKSSRLYFGSASEVSGPGAVTTPLIITSPLLKLILTTISVAGAEDQPIIVKPPQDVNKQGGNIAIDSGSHFTFMGIEVMPPLLELVKKHTPLPTIELTTKILSMHDLDSTFELCFNISNARENYKVPEITLMFAGGAPLVLKVDNAFVMINKDTLCLAILSNSISSGISFIGNLAQINYRVMYDLNARMLTFRQEDC